MANIEEKVENLIKKPIEELGYSLYDVQYVKEGQNYFLRVFIEKPEGSIDLNDCEKVNDGINDILDKADYIKEQYFLEVSSTGLEKVLRKDEHLKQNIGTEVQVNLFKPVDLEANDNVADMPRVDSGKNKAKKPTKAKELFGTLHSYDNDSITIELENKQTIKLERKNITQIKTIFDWDSLE